LLNQEWQGTELILLYFKLLKTTYQFMCFIQQSFDMADFCALVTYKIRTLEVVQHRNSTVVGRTVLLTMYLHGAKYILMIFNYDG